MYSRKMIPAPFGNKPKITAEIPLFARSAEKKPKHPLCPPTLLLCIAVLAAQKKDG